MQARIYSSASPFSSVFPLGFWPCGGLRLGLVRFFKPFRPLALAQQALVAIILQVLRRFRGAALFRSVRPSSTWGFPFWPMGLTVQSSRPAFCGRLTFGVSLHQSHHIQVHALFPGIHHFKRLSAGCWLACWASPAGVALFSRYAGISAGVWFRPALYCSFCVQGCFFSSVGSNPSFQRIACGDR